MLTFDRTTDVGLIRSIVTHPDIYPHVTDDGSPEAKDWQPTLCDAVWFVVVRDDGELLGLWMLHPLNFVTYELHTCLLRCAWGARAAQAAEQMREWMWANIPCKRVVTSVPEYNRLALRFAKQHGFTEFGFNPESYQKNGVLYGQHLLGISKGEQSCQLQPSFQR